MKLLKLAAFAAAVGLCTSGAWADATMNNAHHMPVKNEIQGGDHKMNHGNGKKMHMHGARRAPLGIMGAHLAPQGKFMLTYRYGQMNAEGSRIGTTNVSPVTVATTVPNRFFGLPMQPPTLRVVPTSMKMEMHMFSAMYGLTDRVTLMGMLPYVKREMDALVFAGPVGTTILGTNKMKTEGFGDARISATFGVWEGKSSRLNATLGVSLPTGSTSETGVMLTPMGTRMLRTMAYGMQLGSGTYDLLPAVTYSGHSGNMGYGAQLSGVIRMNRDNGYALGDQLRVNVWGSLQPAPWVTLTGRVEASSIGHIEGMNPRIMGPMQGMDPLNYGGDQVTVFAGANFLIRDGVLRGHRFSVEAGLPVYQDLNGVQLERDWSVNAAWRKMF